MLTSFFPPERPERRISGTDFVFLFSCTAFLSTHQLKGSEFFLNGSANISTSVLRVDRKRSQSAGPGKAIVVAGNEGGKRCNPEDDTGGGGGGGGGKADNADQVC